MFASSWAQFLKQMSIKRLETTNMKIFEKFGMQFLTLFRVGVEFTKNHLGDLRIGQPR